MLRENSSDLFLYFGFRDVILVESSTDITHNVNLERFNLDSYLKNIPTRITVSVLEAKTGNPVRFIIGDQWYVEIIEIYLVDKKTVFSINVSDPGSYMGFKKLTLDQVKAIVMDLQIDKEITRYKKWREIIGKIIRHRN